MPVVLHFFFALLLETPTRAQTVPKAIAIAVGADSLTRLLWNNPDAGISLWRLNPDATVATQYPYGPFTSYTALGLAAGADNAPRILWNRSDGAISLWNDVSGASDFTHMDYGPYSGYAPVAFAVDSTNLMRVLWSGPSGTVSLWQVAANGTFSYRYFTDPAGYLPVGMACGPSGDVRLLWSDGQVWTVAANRTYTAKTYSLVSVPLYLSNLTLSSTSVTGGSGITGIVTLSSPAPSSGITVTLNSNNSAVKVPSNCTVKAGTTQANFNVTITSVSANATATLSGTYNGWTQGGELNVLPANPPAVPSPGVPVIRVAPGNGCAVVSWTRLAAGAVSGYNVYRTSGGTTTLLTPTPFPSNFYPDTGLTNGTAYTYQVSAVDTQGREQALSAPVSATPSSATATLNWNNPPSTVTGNTGNTVLYVSWSSIMPSFGTLLFVDGVQLGSAGSIVNYANGVQNYLTGAGFDFSKLSNGPHIVQYLGFADANETVAGITPPITIQVNNTISSDKIVGGWFDPTQGELCYLSATVPAGSTWTVQVTPQDSTTVLRTWQGASSSVNLAWDGNDASGKLVPLTDYSLVLTVQPPGMSPGTTGAQAAPNAAGTVKKTHPTKVLRSQPVALAFISVGASYYLDSNKNMVVSKYKLLW